MVQVVHEFELRSHKSESGLSHLQLSAGAMGHSTQRAQLTPKRRRGNLRWQRTRHSSLKPLLPGSGAAGRGQAWAVDGPPSPPPSLGSGKTGNQTRGMAGYTLTSCPSWNVMCPLKNKHKLKNKPEWQNSDSRNWEWGSGMGASGRETLSDRPGRSPTWTTLPQLLSGWEHCLPSGARVCLQCATFIFFPPVPTTPAHHH